MKAKTLNFIILRDNVRNGWNIHLATSVLCTPIDEGVYDRETGRILIPGELLAYRNHSDKVIDYCDTIAGRFGQRAGLNFDTRQAL